MFIKRSHCYKQENAIVPSTKWSRNTGGPHTMASFLHCESVGQEKAHDCRGKIGVIIVWFTLPPCSSESCCGPIWWREEAWTCPNVSYFVEKSVILPPTFPPALSYLTPLIETLNSEIRLCAVHPLWTVDRMRGRCDVLFLLRVFQVIGREAAGLAWQRGISVSMADIVMSVPSFFRSVL